MELHISFAQVCDQAGALLWQECLVKLGRFLLRTPSTTFRTATDKLEDLIKSRLAFHGIDSIAVDPDVAEGDEGSQSQGKGGESEGGKGHEGDEGAEGGAASVAGQ